MAAILEIIIKGKDETGALGKAAKALDGISNSASKATGNLKSAQSGLSKIAMVAGGAVVGGAAAAGVAIVGMATSGIKAAADLDQKMADIAAVMGETKETVGPLKDEIMDLAIDPGLKVSATEAAAAVEMLAKNGLKIPDILDGAAKSTIALSNATGGDFALSADIMTDAMAQFGITAKETEQAIDGITSVTVNSKFDINDYALALAQAGGVASAVGVEFDDFNTSIAAISPLFASGSDAGTSFKVFLQRMIPSSEKAAAAMNRLGLEFFDTEGNMKSMTDVSDMLNEKLMQEFEMTVQLGGATKDMAKSAEKATKQVPKLTTRLAEQETKMGILKRELAETASKYGENSIQADKKRLAITKLNNKMNENRKALEEGQGALDAMTEATVQTITQTTKLTEEQKSSTLSTIFGTDAMRAAVGMASAGEVVYKDAAEAVAALGVSHEEAAAVAEGGITHFEALQLTMSKTSALESAATRVDSLKGAMEIFRSVAEGLQIQIGDAFLPVLRKVTVGFTQVASVAGPSIVGFFKTLGRWVGQAVDFISGFGSKFMETFNAMPQSLGFVNKALLALNGALYTLLPQGLRQAVGDLLTAFGELAIVIKTNLFGALSGAGEGFSGLLSSGIQILTNTILPALTTAVRFVADNWAIFQGAIMGVVGAIVGAGVISLIGTIAGVLGALVSPVGIAIAAFTALGAAFSTNFMGIRDIFFTVWDGYIKPAFFALVEFLQVNIPIAIQFLSDFWTNTLNPLLQQFGVFVQESIIPILTQLGQWFQEFLPVAIQFLTDSWNNILLPAIQIVWAFITETLIPAWQDVAVVLNDFIQNILPVLSEVWNTLVETFNTSVKPALNELFAALGELAAALGMNTTETEGTATAAVALKAILDPLITTIQVLTPVITVLGEALSIIIGFVTRKVEEITNLISAFTSLTDSTQSVTDRILNLTSAVADITFPDILTPGSPTPFEKGLTGIEGALSTTVGAFKQMNSITGGATTQIFQQVQQMLVKMLELWTTTFQQMVQVLANAKDQLIVTLTTFTNQFMSLWTAFGVQVNEIWSNLWVMVKATIEQATTEIIAAAQTLMTNFAGAIAAGGSAAATAMGSVMSAIKAAASVDLTSEGKAITKTLIDAMKNYDVARGLSGFESDIKAAVSGFDLITEGEDLMRGLETGMKNINVAAVAGQVTDDIKQAIKSAFNISSPSGFSIDVVDNVMGTMAKRFEQQADKPVAAIERTLGQISNTVINNNVVNNNFRQVNNSPGISVGREFELMASRASAFN